MAAATGRFRGRVEEMKHLAYAWQRATDQTNCKFDLRQERDPNVVV